MALLSTWNECLDVQAPHAHYKSQAGTPASTACRGETKRRVPNQSVFSLDDFVIGECDKEALMFHMRAANSFIIHGIAGFYIQPFYQSTLFLLNRVQKEYGRHGSEMVRTQDQFLTTEPPHTMKSKLSVCTGFSTLYIC